MKRNLYKTLVVSLSMLIVMFCFIEANIIEAIVLKASKDEFMNKIELEWECNCEKNFEVFRAKNEKDLLNGSPIGNLKSNFFTDVSEDVVKSNGNKFYYLIKNSKGDISNVARGWTKSIASAYSPSLYYPKNTKNPSLVNSSENWIVELNWSNMQGAKEYEVQIAQRNLNSWNEDDGFTNNEDDRVISQTVSGNNFRWEIEGVIKEFTTPLTLAWTVRAVFDNGQKGKFRKQTFTLNEEDFVASDRRLPFNIETKWIAKNLFSKGEQMELRLEILKSNNATLVEPKIVYFLSTDENFSIDDVKLAEDELDKLNSDNRSIIERYITVEESIVSGKYHLLAIPENNNNLYFRDGLKSFEINVN